jgi:predicted GTPase
MFPHAASENDADGNPIEPLFISAEHGDGLTDLYQALRKRIPDNQFIDY